MDIRVNDVTIPKKTVNMELKRKYPQGRLTDIKVGIHYEKVT
jgi:ribosomal protein L24